ACISLLLIIVPLFSFNAPAPTEIYTLSLHDALPIYVPMPPAGGEAEPPRPSGSAPAPNRGPARCLIRRWIASRSQGPRPRCNPRSEEHTSELQSRGHLVCRLLLEKKKRMECGK